MNFLENFSVNFLEKFSVNFLENLSGEFLSELCMPVDWIGVASLGETINKSGFLA